MKRAARDLAEEFGRLDTANAALYAANAKAYGATLNELDSWVRRELAAIPRADRELATAHAAFTYFCKEYGFRALPVQGLNRESDPSPSYLAETIEILKREKVRAVFPEQIANPKVLEAMVSASGVRLGGELVADGTGTTTSAPFEGMMRHNVSTIARALR